MILHYVNGYIYAYLSKGETIPASKVVHVYSKLLNGSYVKYMPCNENQGLTRDDESFRTAGQFRETNYDVNSSV